MEGYLTLVTKGFAGTKLRKVWVVLDRQQLSWYDHLDLNDQMPKKLKGMMFVRDATLKKISEINIAHALVIECENVRTVFSCVDANECSQWYKCLTRAVIMHAEQARRDALPRQYRAILQLSNDEELTKASIARAYKKLCLQAHPDKGGDPEVFNKIKEAYNHLMAIQSAKEELESTMAVHYEATLVKQAGKIGLGLGVSDDRVNERLLVGKVQDEIIIKEITEEAEGKIKTGDRIIGIDNDDCSHWQLSRLIARLNLVRIPIGGTVVFTFERRVKLDELESEEDEYDFSPPSSPTPSTIYPRNTGYTPRQKDTSRSVTPKSMSEASETSHSEPIVPNPTPPPPPPSTTTATEPTVTTTTNNSATTATTATMTAAAAAGSAPSPRVAFASVTAELAPPQAAAAPTDTTTASSAVTSAINAPSADPASSDVLGSPTSLQARAAARERLRQRALEAAAQEETPTVVIPAGPVPAAEINASAHAAPATPAAPAAPAVSAIVPPPPAAEAATSSAPPVVATEPLRVRAAPVLAHPTNPVVSRVPEREHHVEHKTNSAHPPADTHERPAMEQAQFPTLRLNPPVRRLGPWTATATASAGATAAATSSVVPHAHHDTESSMPERFREALQLQSESFHRQLESTEAELRQALHSVQERDAQIRTLQAEYDALKETVASMARFLDNTGSTDGKGQKISALHRQLTELRCQVRTLEDVLSKGGEGGAVHMRLGADHDQSTTYREREAQAERVEAMLLNALLQSAQQR